MAKAGKQQSKSSGTGGKRAGKKTRVSSKPAKSHSPPTADTDTLPPPDDTAPLLPPPLSPLMSPDSRSVVAVVCEHEPTLAPSTPKQLTSYGAIPSETSPCRRCQRIGSSSHTFDGGSMSSSITRAETVLVPQFIAAQVDDEALRQIAQNSGPKVAAFYETQNELIAELLSVNQQHTDDALELQMRERCTKQRQVDMAVRVSVVVNVLVVLAQLYAAISSKSLALFATMSEAMMDLLSSIILLLASMAARRRDRFSLYPSGRFKLETIGVIVFAVLMGTFSVALFVESVSALWMRSATPNFLSVYDAVCVVAALVAKIALYFYCYTLREYHTAHVLMTDHRNDVFVNAFGLTMAVIGKHAVAWMDPLGSLIIAIMILRSWIAEAWDQIKLIVGISADPRLIQVLTYTAITHDPRIEKVDRVVAYHSGAKLFVEVDIVMPPCTPLITLHDVAESLQEKYERMPGVGRCHVHVDYEVTHRSEHHNAEA
ncbi:hypothetical protein GGH94_004437 [Coemansia aciculifera]|uniref:Cation efflux protein transmembrane domain-containing protein n=1 Tax=Coemansia aciculifera TaxID=417176 RepID=A0A9W8IHQ8_9FUNG|nr:hypothetical protein GGH94_004437 [Coemansia aciculifera]